MVSNVGEGGYGISAEDRLHRPAAGVIPKSYPAKVLPALLIYRFQNGAAPLLILPCELVSDNGEVLRQLLAGLSDAWNECAEFKAWLAASVTICDTLVDRIVSEPIEPIGAVAEPYGLWAIKRQPGFEPPLQHPSITYTDDLEPFLRLKLHILNRGDPYLAQIWQAENRTGPMKPCARCLLTRTSNIVCSAFTMMRSFRDLPPAAWGRPRSAMWQRRSSASRTPFSITASAILSRTMPSRSNGGRVTLSPGARQPNPSLALPRLEALSHCALQP